MSVEIIQMPPRTVAVHARPNPLSMEILRADFPVGSTIRDMVGPDVRPIRVEIGGLVIPEDMWMHVRPKPTVAVVITAIPQGGSAKSIFRFVAFAALAIGVAAISGGALAAPILTSSGLGTIFGAGSLSAGLLAAGVGLVGSLIINAIIPPQTPSMSSSGGSTDLLKSITGSQNQLNPFGAIGVAMGVVKVYPTHAAKPYTELLGDDQYLRCLFDCGEGDPLISDMRIGDTDISDFTDVETEIGTNPSLFSQDVEEVAVSVTMSDDGDTASRTSAGNASELSADLSWSGGLFGLNDSGDVVSVSCTVKLEYRVHGTSTWTAVGPSTSGLTISSSAAVANSDGTITVTNAARKAVRIGVRWTLSPQQYDVQVTRVSTNWGSSSSDTRVGDMVWTVLRTIRSGAVSSTGTKKVALRIKANDQLNGSISTFNFVLSQQIPVWHPESSSWVTEVSDNPAWLYRWLLKDCPANAKRVPAEMLDDEEILAFANDCAAKGFGFNTFIDSATTIFALAKDILAAGRAAFNVNDGTYSVVRDVAQSVPVQVFTPRNSWGFGGTRAFPDAIHALRVQFINPEAGWQQDERIVYDDGYGDAEMVAANPSLALASKFEVMQIRGCTDPSQAWRLGRYYLATGRLRHTTYTWNADPEHLVCRRGKLVQVANDIIGVGTGWGRITTVVSNSTQYTAIAMDETVTPQPGKSYGVRIRRHNGTVYLSQVSMDVPRLNMLSAAKVTKDAGVQRSDGSLTLGLTGVYSSDYIPVQAGQTYVICTAIIDGNAGYGVAFYDAAHAFVGAGPGLPYTSAGTTFTAPAGAVYMRMTGYYGGSTPDLATQMLLLGNTAPSAYIPYLENPPGVNYFTLLTPLAISGDLDSNLNEGDLVLFGEWGNDKLDLIVTKIEPGADYSAKITAVEAAPAVLSADSGDVPPWTSQITGQVQDPAPAPPSQIDVSSSQALSPADDLGVTSPVMMVAVSGPWSGIAATGHPAVDHLEVRIRTADPVGAWTLQTLQRGEFSTSFSGVYRGTTYQVEARALSITGAASSWTSVTHTVSLPDLSAGLPTSFHLDTSTGDKYLTWDARGGFGTKYEVQEADGSSGVPADGDYVTIYLDTGTSVLFDPPAPSNLYFRVRSITYAGVVSAWTSPLHVITPAPIGG